MYITEEKEDANTKRLNVSSALCGWYRHSIFYVLFKFNFSSFSVIYGGHRLTVFPTLGPFFNSRRFLWAFESCV